MRTPWKFVADLVSRKPKKDTSDDERSIAEFKALQHKTPDEERKLDAEPNNPVTAAEGDRQNETSSTSSAQINPEIAHVSEGSHHSPDDFGQTAAEGKNQALHAPEEEAATARSPERKRRNKPEPATGITAAIVASEVDVPGVPKSFVEEMAEVDAEVDGLRRELVKKLTEQNAQLRKMLARFETR